MSLMLASVVNPVEARLALEGGADVVDVANADEGPVNPANVRAIAATVAAQRPIAAALRGAPHGETFAAEVAALSAAGVGILRVPADAEALNRYGAVLRPIAQNVRFVGVLLADRNADFSALEGMATLRFQGAMLDVAEKGRLLDHMPPPRLEAFVRRCRELRLEGWLAGSLQSPDVPRLLLVEPDVLGFRSALCARGRPDGPLDPRRVALIRDLIPRTDALPPPAQRRGRRGRAQSARNSGESPAESPLAKIFVHDFLIPAEIGAYAHERGAEQRLRFNVEAAVSRVAAPADDMRGVVSYDVILDAVRIVVGRGHVDFLETVAEEVATIVLSEPRVIEVRVRVEKLDIVEGSVGVEIVRTR